MRSIAESEGIDLQGMTVFYYEAEERQFDGEGWLPIEPEADYETHVRVPLKKTMEGFDIVTFCDGPNSHSPLSCNSIAAEVATMSIVFLQAKRKQGQALLDRCSRTASLGRTEFTQSIQQV